MYENVKNCPVCESTEFSIFLICKDFTVTGESFAISKCKNCNFLFTNPRPTIISIDKYYQSDNYISHSNLSTNLVNSLYKIARYFTIRSKYKLITSNIANKGRILDYGCGTGHVLNYFKKKKWQTVGVEPNETARLIAKNQNNLTVFKSHEELQEEQKFDVITLWHVLEHIHSLNEILSYLRSKLEKNGIIYVAVPNAGSYDAKHYESYWAAYDVPRHLYHFTQDTFKLLAKKNKLKVVKILPMKLDAFYVSMLSEKNKTGKSGMLAAVKTALNSNTWAGKNNNNYSSLIYILKK